MRSPAELRVEQRDIAALAPYERNARTHSNAQVAQIAASITQFGWTNPILIDGTNGIIAGHGRLAAAKLLGMSSVPVIELHGLSSDQKRAYVLADNKLALNAGWDDALLAEELRDLAAIDVSFDAIGFDSAELDALLARETSSAEAKSEIPEALADQVWREWASEVLVQIAALRACSLRVALQSVTPAYARWSFLRALYDGIEYPRTCSLAFHPHQLDIAADDRSIIEGLTRVAAGEQAASGLRWCMNGRMDAKIIGTSGISLGGARLPMDFPADLARALCDEFAPSGAVLDPCHGWGGRLVGFLLSKAHEYRACDPAPLTHAGVCEIRDLLAPVAHGRRSIALSCECYEDAHVLEAHYDLALTSPPYFDTESYVGGAQSRETHATYAAWRDGFYTTLIRKTHAALKPAGVFALQIGSQRYPLLDDARAIARACGFSILAVRSTEIVNNQAKTAAHKGEVLLLLRKQ